MPAANTCRLLRNGRQFWELFWLMTAHKYPAYIASASLLYGRFNRTLSGLEANPLRNSIHMQGILIHVQNTEHVCIVRHTVPAFNERHGILFHYRIRNCLDITEHLSASYDNNCNVDYWLMLRSRSVSGQWEQSCVTRAVALPRLLDRLGSWRTTTIMMVVAVKTTTTTTMTAGDGGSGKVECNDVPGGAVLKMATTAWRSDNDAYNSDNSCVIESIINWPSLVSFRAEKRLCLSGRISAGASPYQAPIHRPLLITWSVFWGTWSGPQGSSRMEFATFGNTTKSRNASLEMWIPAVIRNHRMNLHCNDYIVFNRRRLC